MSKILRYLREYVREDFNAAYYGLIALGLIAAFWYNYSRDFKENILNAAITEPIGIAYYALFYGTAYFGASLLWSLMYRDYGNLRSLRYWGIGAFVLCAMSLDNYSVNLPYALMAYLDVPASVHYWLSKCILNIDRTIAILVPLVFFYILYDKQPSSFYGLTLKNFDWKPYAGMLLIMLPLIIWASYQPSFLNAYPRYKAGSAETYLDVSRMLTYGVFETTYAIRFISVEIFFRGFLAYGLFRYFGRQALMPMVVLYAFWHFGKPMGEAIGSIFGGYILGVLAIRTETIFGGICIHIGVALLMDLAAYLQLYVLH